MWKAFAPNPVLCKYIKEVPDGNLNLLLWSTSSRAFTDTKNYDLSRRLSRDLALTKYTTILHSRQAVVPPTIRVYA